MIFLAILLTAFVYLIFPILYVANNGKVNPKKGKKIALSNSIVCASFFFLITLIIVSTSKDGWGAEIGGYSLAPAFLYYFIAKAILTDKNLNDDTEKPSETAKKTDVSDTDGENDFYSELSEDENSENLNNDCKQKKGF
ncbi:MAG: hypothetical protein IJQ66_04705 [Clostridia bacterium]|nr:hypothetical protein [Clostridia bacterium]